MTSSTTWKNEEAKVGRRWFNAPRNPLSGRNNVDDQGNRRLGDIVYAHAVVEVKVRSSIASLARALQTKALAKTRGLPWVHIERQKGDGQTYLLACDVSLMDVAMAAIRGHIEAGASKGEASA